MLTRIEIDCETGEEIIINLTPEEISEQEAEIQASIQRQIEIDAEIEAKLIAKESAKAKLEALGLTPEEIASL
jgi:hypothetical protein